MALQTVGSYTDLMPAAFEGGPGDASIKECETGVNETEAMPFGRAVQFDATGTVDRSVKLANAAGGGFKGITYHSHFGTQFDLVTGVAQVSTVTVAAVALADGDTFRITLFMPGIGAGIQVEVVRAAGVPAAVNDVAAALRLLINNNPQLSLAVTATGAGADVVITADEPGSFGVFTEIVDGGGTPTLVHALTTGGEADGIPANDAANLLKKGTTWLRPEDPVTPASGVFMRVTANAGVGTALGAFRGTADGGNTVDVSAFAEWLTSSEGGSDGGLAKIKVNLPGG